MHIFGTMGRWVNISNVNFTSKTLNYEWGSSTSADKDVNSLPWEGKRGEVGIELLGYMVIADYPGPTHIQRCCLTRIWNPILEMQRLDNYLVFCAQWGLMEYIPSIITEFWLTHWRQNGIIQMTFLNAISCMNIIVFWFKFHRYLFPMVQQSIASTGRDNGLALNRWQVITWSNIGLKLLTHICIVKH